MMKSALVLPRATSTDRSCTTLQSFDQDHVL